MTRYQEVLITIVEALIRVTGNSPPMVAKLLDAKRPLRAEAVAKLEKLTFLDFMISHNQSRTALLIAFARDLESQGVSRRLANRLMQTVYRKPKTLLSHIATLIVSEEVGEGTASGTQHILESQAKASVVRPERVFEGTQVEILFATNRTPLLEQDFRGSLFSDRHADGILTYGKAQVNIPDCHKLGQVERPRWFSFRESLRKHIVVNSRTVIERDEFATLLEEELNMDGQRAAVIFVHGFNVDFDSSLRVGAQIRYDLQLHGPFLVFNWASKAELGSYLADEETAAISCHDFKRLLIELSQTTGLQKVHVIAHSMGNRIASQALHELALEAKVALPIVFHCVMAAPDVARPLLEILAETVRKAAHKITLYCSERDIAINTSQFLHDYGRGGNSAEGICGFDVIDATDVSTGFYDHSYFRENRTVLSDIAYVLQGVPIEQRHGLAKEGDIYAFMP